ncbi:MAG: maleate cis-trans isomerase [Rhodospirillaceae bacterium]|jgi:maleate isomerase|nr:maleate cis-trans isomerase [Rhodospirillaceae bacterium]MBT6117611.1 maleate cis-trans isomerase [Rhodospirillaceae bacterium]
MSIVDERGSGFAPDGWAYRARVGLLVPDVDIGPESEWAAMAPAGVSVHASRFRFPIDMLRKEGDRIGEDAVRFVADGGPLDEATALFGEALIDIVALAFTSTSYLGGEGADARIVERLRKLSRGRPVVTTGQAMIDALAALDAKQVMLVDPPWFPAKLSERGGAWLEHAGFSVAAALPAGLPSGQENIHPGHLYRWVRANLADGTEAIAIGGNGFRAVGAIEALERDLGLPVITANTALLWATLRALGLPTAEVTRYGRLFALPD